MAGRVAARTAAPVGLAAKGAMAVMAMAVGAAMATAVKGAAQTAVVRQVPMVPPVLMVRMGLTGPAAAVIPVPVRSLVPDV